MNKNKRLNIIRGGVAKQIPGMPNYYFMKGLPHELGGIDIGKDLEVEGNEVVHVGKDNIKVYSSVPFLNGVSPAEKVLGGNNPTTVFREQEQFKKINGLKDDGTKKELGGKDDDTNVRNSTDLSHTAKLLTDDFIYRRNKERTAQGLAPYNKTEVGKIKDIVNNTPITWDADTNYAGYYNQNSFPVKSFGDRKISYNGRPDVKWIPSGGVGINPNHNNIEGTIGHELRHALDYKLGKVDTPADTLDIGSHVLKLSETYIPETTYGISDASMRKLRDAYTLNEPDTELVTTNFDIRQEISRRNNNAVGEDLDKAIESISDEELFNILKEQPYIKNVNSYTNNQKPTFTKEKPIRPYKWLDTSYSEYDKSIYDKYIKPWETNSFDYNHRFFRGDKDKEKAFKKYIKKGRKELDNDYENTIKQYNKEMLEYNKALEEHNKLLKNYERTGYNGYNKENLNKVRTAVRDVAYNNITNNKISIAKLGTKKKLGGEDDDKIDFNYDPDIVGTSPDEIIKYYTNKGFGKSPITNEWGFISRNGYNYNSEGRRDRYDKEFDEVNKIGYIGGSPTEARRKFYKSDKRFTQVVDSIADSHGLPRRVLKNSLANEGFIDTAIGDINTNYLKRRKGEAGYDNLIGDNLLNKHIYNIGFTRMGNDDSKTYYNTRKDVKRIIDNSPIKWETVRNINEKDREVLTMDGSNNKANIVIHSALLTSFRNEIKKQHPNWTNDQIDNYTLYRFNYGPNAKGNINDVMKRDKFNAKNYEFRLGGKMNNKTSGLYSLTIDGKNSLHQFPSTGESFARSAKGKVIARGGTKKTIADRFRETVEKDTKKMSTKKEIKKPKFNNNTRHNYLKDAIDYITSGAIAEAVRKEAAKVKPYQTRKPGPFANNNTRRNYLKEFTYSLFNTNVNDTNKTTNSTSDSKINNKRKINKQDTINSRNNNTTPIDTLISRSDTIKPDTIKSDTIRYNTPSISSKVDSTSTTSKVNTNNKPIPTKSNTPSTKNSTSTSVPSTSSTIPTNRPVNTRPVNNRTTNNNSSINNRVDTPKVNITKGINVDDWYPEAMMRAMNSDVSLVTPSKPIEKQTPLPKPKATPLNHYSLNGIESPVKQSKFKTFINNTFNKPNTKDIIGAGSNIVSSIIAHNMNKNMLNDLEYSPAPITRRANKLKTKININPQIDAMRESLANYRQHVNDNTASSRVARALMNRGLNSYTAGINQLYGNKENQETELINKDRLNQQEVANANIADYNTWRANKVAFNNAIREKKSENDVGLISNINAGIQDIISRGEKRFNERQNRLALMAANPNVNPSLLRDFGIEGITDEDIRNYYKAYGNKNKKG